MTNDERLIARVSAGDDLALGTLYDIHAPFVYGLARRITGSTTAAEDVTQEVFVFLWEHPERFDGSRGSMHGFLGAIAHRRAVDVVRHEIRLADRRDRVDADATIGWPSGGTHREVADQIVAADLAARVRGAVASLPSAQRAALELAYFAGCTSCEVARRLGIPEGTAKTRLRLGMRKLAIILGTERGLT